MKKITRFGPPAVAETLEAARLISGKIEVPRAAPNPEAIICKDLRRVIMMVAWLEDLAGFLHKAPLPARSYSTLRELLS